MINLKKKFDMQKVRVIQVNCHMSEEFFRDILAPLRREYPEMSTSQIFRLAVRKMKEEVDNRGDKDG